MSRTLFTVLILVSLLTACAANLQNPQATPQASSPGPSETGGTWTIKMTHSGGIMGLLRTIEVSSDGTYKVADERAKKTVQGKLSSQELNGLAKLMKTVKTAPTLKPNQAVCADCFVYDIEFRDGTKSFQMQLNDISLPGSGFENLVTSLRSIMDGSLKQ
jgi:hypothetical protein